jgi:hypothetical protein
MPNAPWAAPIEFEEPGVNEAVCPWCRLVHWVPNGFEFPRTSCCPSIVVCSDCAEDARV